MISNTSDKDKGVLLLFLLVATGCYIFGYYTAWKSLVNAWASSDDYSHAFLILPISMYLIWEKREELKEMPWQPSWIGLAVVFFSCLLTVFSVFAGIYTLVSFSLVLSLIGMVLALFGLQLARKILFPLGFLFLMIPIPSQLYFTITTPLQIIVTKVSSFAGSLLDIPIYREGNVIHLPDRTLQVVEACSGLRSLISLSTLSLVLAYFSLQKNLFRAILVSSSLPIAIAVNVFRVTLMIVAIYFFNFDLSVDPAHTYLGLFVFAIALLIVFFLQKIFARMEQ